MNLLFFVFCIVWSASFPLAANAQDATSAAEQQAQENWLRYSNWEHRSNSPRRNTAPKEKASTSSKAEPDSAQTLANPATAQGKVQLPENPGSQTVDGAQAMIPGWAFQPPPQVQRSPQIFVGGDTLGSRPGSYGSPAGYYGSAFNNNLLGFGSGNGFGIPGLGSGFGTWGHGASWKSGGGWGNGPFSSAAAWNSGFGGLGAYHGGFGCYNGGFVGGLGSGFGSLGYGAGSWNSGSGGWGQGYTSGWQGHGNMGSEVIETGPSPASGNYYQPSAIDPSASGNYYAGSAPWQVPISSPSTPKDYWGPQGSPFKQ